jgi:predicted metal-dependent phosphoesterase TrpH
MAPGDAWGPPPCSITSLLVKNGYRSSTTAFELSNPYSSKGRWHKGQLHCHTSESDGDLSPAEVLALYRKLGFEIVALADHNLVTRASSPDLLVIGQEFGRGSTESSGRGHMVGLNVHTFPSPGASPQRRIGRMASQGGLVFLSHPNTGAGWSTPLLRSLHSYVGIEIYNCNHEDMAVRNWDELLTSGKKLWGFAVDDAHYLHQFGKGWVTIKFSGEPTTRKVLAALQRGSFYSTQGPEVAEIAVDGPMIWLRAIGADKILFRGSGGKVLQTTRGSSAKYEVLGNEGYVRAELVSSNTGLRAWLQPMTMTSSKTETPRVTPGSVPLPG